MRIACTGVMPRIKAGRPSKDGSCFVGNPTDVTSDCLKAVIEFVGVGHCTTVHVNGLPAYEITVNKVAAQSTGEMAKKAELYEALRNINGEGRFDDLVAAITAQGEKP